MREPLFRSLHRKDFTLSAIPLECRVQTGTGLALRVHVVQRFAGQRVDRRFGHEREFRFDRFTLGLEVFFSVGLQLSFQRTDLVSQRLNRQIYCCGNRVRVNLSTRLVACFLLYLLVIGIPDLIVGQFSA